MTTYTPSAIEPGCWPSRYTAAEQIRRLANDAAYYGHDTGHRLTLAAIRIAIKGALAGLKGVRS